MTVAGVAQNGLAGAAGQWPVFPRAAAGWAVLHLHQLKHFAFLIHCFLSVLGAVFVPYALSLLGAFLSAFSYLLSSLSSLLLATRLIATSTFQPWTFLSLSRRLSRP